MEIILEVECTAEECVLNYLLNSLLYLVNYGGKVEFGWSCKCIILIYFFVDK